MADRELGGGGEGEKAHVNIYSVIFGPVRFSAIRRGKVYGDVSKGEALGRTLANALVSLGPHGRGGYIRAKIKAVEVKTREGKKATRLDFGWMGSAQTMQSCFVLPETPDALSDYEAWQKGVKAEYRQWREAMGGAAVQTVTGDDDLIEGVNFE